MANVFGGGSSNSCSSGGQILPAPRAAVTPARVVTSNPNVFNGAQPITKQLSTRDFYTRRELDKYLDTKVDISSVYNKLETYAKKEVDDKISGLNISAYALSTYVDSEISTSSSSFISYVATNYYLKTQLYTKTEIDSLVDSASLGDSYLSKSPTSISDITIAPANGTLPVSLVVQSSNNLD